MTRQDKKKITNELLVNRKQLKYLSNVSLEEAKDKKAAKFDVNQMLRVGDLQGSKFCGDRKAYQLDLKSSWSHGVCSSGIQGHIHNLFLLQEKKSSIHPAVTAT